MVWLYISTGYTYRFGADPSLAETMIKAEKGVQASEYIGGLGRGKGNDDRNDRVDKPDTPFLAFWRLASELTFEFFEDVV